MTALSLASRVRRAAFVGAVCAGVAVGATGLTGCGGSGEDPDAGTNGVGRLSATKIQSKAGRVAEAASGVRLSGTVVSKGHTYSLDMRLKDDGGTGSVTSKGQTFQLLRVGEQLFLKAGSEFWTHEGDGGQPQKADQAAAAKLDGKYVKVPKGDPAYEQLSGFTDKDVLLAGMLTLHGKLAKGDRGKTGATRTIKITGDEGAGGTLSVALDGKPYPLRFERGGHAGTLKLTEWNKDFPLQEPDRSEMVDYGKELPTS
ncbi:MULTISPECIES: hypothetical protein [unclassified Streptomyces]|uniref:hypothetical protein n=1 Tax=unclassified Streptomyces TaxID=2593676 RepID=UPI000747D008|nr:MULTISPECIES: hypothetical protein [unclassified Streptomyces]KUL51721.1 hypothetical protein ADL30_26365 [Streptomyces sp. NRRL S-1521]THC52635.1 hypothetical protein E7X58_11715 [Streptomyces sp. A1499]